MCNSDVLRSRLQRGAACLFAGSLLLASPRAGFGQILGSTESHEVDVLVRVFVVDHETKQPLPGALVRFKESSVGVVRKTPRTNAEGQAVYQLRATLTRPISLLGPGPISFSGLGPGVEWEILADGYQRGRGLVNPGLFAEYNSFDTVLLESTTEMIPVSDETWNRRMLLLADRAEWEKVDPSDRIGQTWYVGPLSHEPRTRYAAARLRFVRPADATAARPTFFGFDDPPKAPCVWLHVDPEPLRQYFKDDLTEAADPACREPVLTLFNKLDSLFVLKAEEYRPGLPPSDRPRVEAKGPPKKPSDFKQEESRSPRRGT